MSEQNDFKREVGALIRVWHGFHFGEATHKVFVWQKDAASNVRTKSEVGYLSAEQFINCSVVQSDFLIAKAEIWTRTKPPKQILPHFSSARRQA